MQSRGYITIQDWMLEYDLDIYETIVLATIFGFSQDGESRFTGSQNFLARKAKCSRRKIVTCLANLQEKGLIEKHDINVRGIHLCEYTFKGCEQDAQGVNEMQGGCAPDAHNNKDIYKNTLSIKRFVKPTIEEVRLYCLGRMNNVNPEKFFNFYESNGWRVGKSPMQDWKAAVRTWEQRSESPRFMASPSPRESVLEHNLKEMDQMFGTDMHSQAYGKKEVADEQ